MTATRIQEDWLARELVASAPADGEAARDYHETTKLTPQRNLRLGRRVNAINSDPELFRAFTRGWKEHLSCERLSLPAATPSGRGVEEILARPRPRLAPGAPPRVTIAELATVLRASYGPTGAKPLRARPGELHLYRATASSGGLYPLEIYPIVHAVAGCPPGIYHYDVRAHALEVLAPGAARAAVEAAIWDRGPCGDVTLVVAAVLPRTMSKYLFRGYRFALYDTGALLCSLTASAAAAGLGCESVEAFFDDEVAALVGADGVDEQVAALLALGAAAEIRP